MYTLKVTANTSLHGGVESVGFGTEVSPLPANHFFFIRQVSLG